VRICYSVRWLFSASVRALPGNASINICVNQLVFVPCLYVQEVPQEYIGSTLRPQYPAIHACSAPLASLPSYNTLVLMDAQQFLPKVPDNVKFRVLIIGRANAGKTSILQRVCDTTESPEIYRLGPRGKRERVRSHS